MDTQQPARKKLDPESNIF